MWGWFLGIAVIFGLCFGEASKSNKLAAVGFLILTLACLGLAGLFAFQGR